MKKIAIVGFHSLHLMQFLYKYTEILDKHSIDYDVIYWDRNVDTSIKYKPFNGNKIAFHYKMDNYQPKRKKIVGFIRCVIFSYHTLIKGNYERVIFLTTQTILPLNLYAKFKEKKYIYDYRDVTYEHNQRIKTIIKNLIEKSYVTYMSSLGFKEILGENQKIMIAHNCSNLRYEAVEKKLSDEIRIVFWGMIRQIEFHKKICDCFGNKNRFKVFYHGEGSGDMLRAYCASQSYNNIHFQGRYTTDEITTFASTTDILLNLYDNDWQQKNALTVKMYDAIRYNLPMLVTAGSYMENFFYDNDAVYAVEIGKLDVDAIVGWFKSLDKNRYMYAKELKQIQADDAKFEEIFLNFCTGDDKK